jgi:hypothetical protein
MAKGIMLRRDYDAAELRRLARGSKDSGQARRLCIRRKLVHWLAGTWLEKTVHSFGSCNDRGQNQK